MSGPPDPQVHNLDIDPITAEVTEDDTTTTVTIAYRVIAEVSEETGKILDSVDLNVGVGPSGNPSAFVYAYVDTMSFTGTTPEGNYLYEGYDWSPPATNGQELRYQVVAWYMAYTGDSLSDAVPE